MDTNTQVKPVETPPAAKAKKPIYKRWWAIALAAVFVIGGISQAMGGGDDAKPVADTPAASAPVEEKSEPKAKEPVAEAPETTQAPAPKPKPAPAPAKPTMTKARSRPSARPRTTSTPGHFSKSGSRSSSRRSTARASPRTMRRSRSITSRSNWNEQAREAAEHVPGLQSLLPLRSDPSAQSSTAGFTQTQAVLRREQGWPLSRLVRVGPRLGGAALAARYRSRHRHCRETRRGAPSGNQGAPSENQGAPKVPPDPGSAPPPRATDVAPEPAEGAARSTANPIQHFPIWSERDGALAPVTRYNPKVSATTVVAERQKEQHMTDIMIRVEAEDYDAWLKTHYDHVEDRHSYGMTDGPVYRDIDNSNSALFHIHVENLDRAMQWFRTDTFKEATKRATVVGRDFYLAEKQQPRPQA